MRIGVDPVTPEPLPDNAGRDPRSGVGQSADIAGLPGAGEGGVRQSQGLAG